MVFLLLLSGCASIDPGCYKIKEFIVPDPTCNSGYMNGLTSITGHSPECLSPSELVEIQKECPNWR